MAPRFLSKIGILVTILAVSLAGLPSSVSAAGEDSSTQEVGTKLHVLKFYLPPAMVPDLGFAKAVLPQYVQDMNAILAKNTSRQFVFDPATDIILTNSQPFSNQGISPLPVENFEIWACISQSPSRYSYGGYGGLDTSGAGVLAGLYWAKLYDPNNLKPSELVDYWTQVNNMLHELAHVFGAGIGEYYKISRIIDQTAVSPLLNINVLDPNDPYWSDKADFLPDPLLRNAAQISGMNWSSRQQLIAYVKFSSLTAAIISNDYRNSAPEVDLQHINVHVTDEQGNAVAGATVKVWSVVGEAPFQSQLMLNAGSDAQGLISFAWGGPANPHSNFDFLRLIKVYKDGYLAAVKYVSIFDADIARLVHDQDVLDVSVSLQPVVAPVLAEGDYTDVSMSEDASPTPFSLTLSAMDTGNGTLSWNILSQPAHGTASVSGTGASQTISYHPALHYYGRDTFVVQVSDINGGADSITVNVFINAVEEPHFKVFLPIVIR